MPTRRLSVRKIHVVLRMKFELKLTHREIAKSLNISAGTVGEYLRLAKAANISWPLVQGTSDDDLYARLYQPVAKGVQRPRPDWGYIHQELRRKGVTLILLWREYREIHSDGLGYTRFCCEYQAYAKTLSPVMRQIYKGGEKCFVDYAGMTVPWIELQSGEIFEAQIFVGNLGASNYTYVEATPTQALPDWIGSHVRMFEFFGGVPHILIPDNLKAGVSKAHRYDPDINPNYQYFGEHYSVAIVPARVAEPRDKAKVEAAVKFIENQILAVLRNHTFTSIAQINAAIAPLLKVFNEKGFQKLPGTRRSQFESLDKPALKSLPLERYEYSTWKKARVNIDYHVVFENHYYSVPYVHIHREISLRATSKTVEIFYKNERIAVHKRNYQKYAYTTLNKHMPAHHRAYAKWTPERLKAWAGKIGQATADFITQMIAARPFPEQAYRACLGVLRLGNRYGELRLEKACERALLVGATRYRQIQTILENNMDKLPLPNAEPSQALPSHHENVRGSIYYYS